MPSRILVIDDDAVAAEVLQETLSVVGYAVDLYTSAQEALRLDLSQFDLLLSDIRMPEMDGLEFLRRVHGRWPHLPVILMTAYGDLETTMEALRVGAWDYISKPFSPDAIRSLVRRVLEVRDLKKNQNDGKSDLLQKSQFIGSSPTMVHFYKQLARVADASASVLIEGESGTGKELAARSLHQLSVRRDQPFLSVHCGALSEAQLERELFGCQGGAAAGGEQDQNQEGMLEAARGGTLFFDEITEMSPSMQVKLLRFMQNGEVRRLGGQTVRQVTVRVVAAAHQKVDEEVDRGRFRTDLLYRFVVRLQMPPLRSHREDIPQLVDFLLVKMGYPRVRLSAEARQCFLSYDWPGNVRELENVLQQTLLLSPYEQILPENLPEHFHPPPPADLSRTPLEEAERTQILQVLRAENWNQSRAAQRLGIDRKTLRTKILRYGLNREEN
jgi:DNA-binding NtrC family response regulator